MKITILLGLLSLSNVCGYKILCISSTPVWGHHVLMRSVVAAMLHAHHNVTWITPYSVRSKSRNLKVINIESLLVPQKGVIEYDTEPKDIHNFTQYMGRGYTKIIATHEPIRDILITEQFDVVVTEWYYSHLHAGFAATLNVPWIVVYNGVYNPYLEYLMNEIRSLSIMPLMTHDYTIPLNLASRISNVYYGLKEMYELSPSNEDENIYYSLFKDIAEKRGTTLPDFSSAAQNITLAFVNSHPAYSPALSYPPNVVQIGGIHLEYNENMKYAFKERVLRQHNETVYNKICYVNLGNSFDVMSLPDTIRDGLFEGLSRLPYKVFWRSNTELPKKFLWKPKLDQEFILSMPETVVFITNAGLLSVMDGIHHGVPMITIPMFGDQFANAGRLERAGYAIRVDLDEDIEENIRTAVLEITRNIKYRAALQSGKTYSIIKPIPLTRLLIHHINETIEAVGEFRLVPVTWKYNFLSRWFWDGILIIGGLFAIIIKKVLNIIRRYIESKASREKIPEPIRRRKKSRK